MRITQQTNSYRDLGSKIFKYLVSRGYDIFQHSMCVYSWFERPYFTNYRWCLVGFYEFGLEASHYLE